MDHKIRPISLIAAISIVCIVFMYLANLLGKLLPISRYFVLPEDDLVNRENLCPQPEELAPPVSNVANASIFLNDDYRNRSFELLGNAVRIPTISYDDLAEDPSKDKRLEVFHELHEFLIRSFPLAAKHLEIVNSYGLLYTFNGSDPSLKPLVLMAHQDVVPVEYTTEKDWEHPPFSGHFDGTRIWGRGSSDTKNSLIAILEATTMLIEQKFEFQRTVILSFGFDEEVGGLRGARALADVLRSRYGPSDSIHMIIDEGSGVSTRGGTVMGAVGVSEKGYTDVEFTLHTRGGHSSVPPDHTGIGIMSALIVHLENEHQANARYEISPDDVIVSLYKCKAQYDADVDEETYANYTDISRLRNMLKENASLRPYISSTHAIDIINGGVKINALPEQVKAIMNIRIDVHDSVKIATDSTAEIVKGFIKTGRYGDIGMKLNGKTIIDSASPTYIEVNNTGSTKEPIPASPFSLDSEQWRLLAGTTMHTLQEWFGVDYAATIPMAFTANTDTYQYRGLSKNVYRYTVGLPNNSANVHTVNEWVSAESHLATVMWYYELLQFM